MLERKNMSQIQEIFNLANEIKGKKISEIIEEIDFLESNESLKIDLLEKVIKKQLFNDKVQQNLNSLNIKIRLVPLVINKSNGEKRPKEKLILNTINKTKILNEEFTSSDFFTSNKRILFITYIQNYDAKVIDFLINDVFLFNLENDDTLHEIYQDWLMLQEFVKNSSNLSERHFKYLYPIYKHQKSDQDFQENQEELSYSFKTQFLKTILDHKQRYTVDYFVNNLNKIRAMSNIDRESLIYEFLDSIKGESIEILNNAKNWHEGGFKKLVKESNPLLFDLMYNKTPYLKISHKLTTGGKIEQEINTNVNFDPLEIINEDFENSSLFYEVIDKKYIIIKIDKTTQTYQDYSIFEFDEEKMEKCKEAFHIVKNQMKSALKFNSDERINPDLKISNNLVIHLRPHARKADVTYKTKGKDLNMTILVWWINKKEIS